MPDQILVVDDDEVSREVLALLLHSAGYAVETAESGDAALLHLQTADSLPQVKSAWIFDAKGHALANSLAPEPREELLRVGTARLRKQHLSTQARLKIRRCYRYQAAAWEPVCTRRRCELR